MADKAKEQENGKDGKDGKETSPDQNDEDDLPNDHKILTIISMVLCSLILNIFAFFCLIPAYYYSTIVSPTHLFIFIPVCSNMLSIFYCFKYLNIGVVL